MNKKLDDQNCMRFEIVSEAPKRIDIIERKVKRKSGQRSKYFSNVEYDLRDIISLFILFSGD